MRLIRKVRKKLKEGYLREMYKEVRWMYRYAKQYWTSICFYMFAGVFGVLMGLGSSVATKYLIDAVVGRKKEVLLNIVLALLGLSVANIVSQAIIGRVSEKIRVDVRNEIQMDIYNKVIYTDWESLHDFRSGDLLNRLSTDAETVSASIIGWFPGLLIRLVQFLGTLGILLYYDAVMAGIALLSAPVMLLLSRVLLKRMRAHNKEMRELSSDLMSFQNDSFRNIQTVKAFGMMEYFGKSLLELLTNYKEKILEYNKFSIYTSSVLSSAGMVVSYLCMGWSAYRLWTGYITVGTMMMFLQMGYSLSGSFSSLVHMIPAAIHAATCAGRLMEIAELKKEKIVDKDIAERLKKKKDCGICVQLKNVSIVYKEGNLVLEHGNFEAKQGEITALVGPSGEGKTSLIRLLLGLIYPSEGEAILIEEGGEQLRISSGTRELFGYVPQGNTVFSGTIAQNMRMVKSDATEEEIIKALQAGCAWEFVRELPDGIDSVIGEGGTGFSEGQAQRLAISRALLRDAPILLLDEATSSLDMEIEREVLDNIMHYGRKKTCIVTTHRPSLLEISDNVYEIKDSHLVKIRGKN